MVLARLASIIGLGTLLRCRPFVLLDERNGRCWPIDDQSRAAVTGVDHHLQRLELRALP
jgi:hypothetical protein